MFIFYEIKIEQYTIRPLTQIPSTLGPVFHSITLVLFLGLGCLPLVYLYHAQASHRP
jgi:hypothetical protein